MPLTTTIAPDQDTFLMDESMMDAESPGTEKPIKDDSDTFILFDIDQEILIDSDQDIESDSDCSSEGDSVDDDDDDDDSSSDEEDDEELAAAEELLQNVQKRRSRIKKTYSFGANSSLASTASIGSLAGLFGQPVEQIQNKMMAKSIAHKNANKIANSTSAADIQALLQQHRAPTAEDHQRPSVSRSNSTGDLGALFGHIQQEASLAKIEVDDGAIHPDEHLAKILGGEQPKFAHDSLDGFFLESRPEYREAWTNEITRMVRERDLPAMEAMHARGQMLQACNNFGESIVHLTVRRGTPEMLRFLLQDAQVSMRVCCENGRTPLHDAAWCLSSNPKAYQMMALLLKECPMLLLIKDKRGSTPLAFVPRKSWAECNAFLDRQFAKGRFASLMMK